MASIPPPYPPPPGAPFGFDPRQQRRMLRDQAQALKASQRAALQTAAAQRDLYRRQARAMRRGSILGPLIVITAGVVLLLIRTGKLPFLTFVAWYGRWWPLLFVAAGLVLLLEWGIDQRTRPEAVPYVRRGMGGGVVLLLLVLAVTGVVVRGSREPDFWMHGVNINQDNLAEFLGEKHDREQTIDRAFPPGTSLSIEDPHGDVTVTGTSDDNQIHITVYKQVYSRSDAEADRKADELSPGVELTGGRLSINVPSNPGSSADLTVTVPDFAQATIDSGRGDVHVTGLKSPLTVTASHGDVDVNSIQGTVVAHINHSDSSFSAHGIQGDVSLKGHADDLNLTDISGTVSLDGDFYGDTHLEHIGGATSFRTSRTTFSFAKLNGMVDISPDAELTGDGLDGPTLLTTRSRNITLSHTTGNLEVSNSNGAVDLSSVTPLGDVTVNNHGGSVTVTVPEGAAFAVQAETRDGEIADDFGLSPERTNDTARLNASVGSGHARVQIDTTHGDIAVRKAMPPAPLTPVPLKAPETPRPPAARPRKKAGVTVTF